MELSSLDDEYKKTQLTQHHLEKRNYFSIERTFLSAVRTISIFAGISLLFINGNAYVPANLILISAIILMTMTCIKFYLYKEKYKIARVNVEHFNPFWYAILLILILFFLLYYSMQKMISTKR